MTVVWRGDFPDPFLLRAHGRWYAYATQTRDVDLQVMTSPDLLTWTHLGNALAGLPRWAAPGHSWSPAVLPRPDGYVLYYATRLRAAGRQALSVAVADRPEGPYVDASEGPLVYQRSRGGSIDPDPFVDADGTAYLLWKSEDNALGGRTVLWARRLRPDGLGFAGRPAKVLRQELAWQRPLVEAPSMVLHDGTYHLLYSAGWWESPGYGVGHATSARPTGPFTVTSRDGPWLYGPGGPGGPGGRAGRRRPAAPGLPRLARRPGRLRHRGQTGAPRRPAGPHAVRARAAPAGRSPGVRTPGRAPVAGRRGRGRRRCAESRRARGPDADDLRRLDEPLRSERSCQRCICVNGDDLSRSVPGSSPL